jgi:hypothetical protein
VCVQVTVGSRRWLRKRWNAGYCVSVLLLFANTIVALSVAEVGDAWYVQLCRTLRPALFIFKSRQIRRLVSTMTRILPQIATTLMFGGVLVMLYAVAGIALFRGRSVGCGGVGWEWAVCVVMGLGWNVMCDLAWCDVF